MEAVLLIISEKMRKDQVANKLLGNPGVINAHTVFGAYDVIAFVDVEDVAALEEMIKKDIQGIQLITALVPDTEENPRHRTNKRIMFN